MKRYRITINHILAFFTALTICSLVAGMVLNIYKSSLWIPVMILGGMSLFVVLVFVFTFAIRSSSKYYRNKPLTYVQISDAQRVKDAVVASGYRQVADNFWTKKVICFTKDSIRYYVKFLDSEDSLKDFQREYEACAKLNDERRFFCLILVMRMSHVQEKDKEFLKTCALSCLDEENTPARGRSYVCLPVIIDSARGELCFFDMQSRFSFTVYAHGCRALNNLLAKSIVG